MEPNEGTSLTKIRQKELDRTKMTFGAKRSWANFPKTDTTARISSALSLSIPLLYDVLQRQHTQMLRIGCAQRRQILVDVHNRKQLLQLFRFTAILDRQTVHHEGVDDGHRLLRPRLVRHESGLHQRPLVKKHMLLLEKHAFPVTCQRLLHGVHRRNLHGVHRRVVYGHQQDVGCLNRQPFVIFEFLQPSLFNQSIKLKYGRKPVKKQKTRESSI